MNCQGQTKLKLPKQLFIQNHLKTNIIDVLLCQETQVDNNIFNNCEFILNNYNIIKNNAENEYETLILIKNTIQVSDVAFDTEGRVIVLNSGNLTIINVYPKAGTDAESRRQREELFSNTVPNMRKYKKPNLPIGGDWICITDPKDCTNFAEQKISTSLKRLIKVLGVHEAYRHIEPNTRQFSRYYNCNQN